MVRPLSRVFGYVDDPKTLMYGTDWPLADMHSAIEAFKRAIPREYWRAVFRENAVRVFKLKGQ
jgi:predicted TIM-barrel fold metal-dependent hydrolase